jgi:hypothetical protein
MGNQFRHPINGHIQKISGLSWLWALLFGPFFYASHRAWLHVVVALLLWPGGLYFVAAPLVVLTGPVKSSAAGAESFLLMLPYSLCGFGYAFFAGRILRKHYRRSGWLSPTVPQGVASEHRTASRF